QWKQVKRGDGQVVLISGETGIGKSLIAETMLERLSNEPYIRLRYFCSPHHQDSALYPSVAQLERAAGVRGDGGGERRLDDSLGESADNRSNERSLPIDLVRDGRTRPVARSVAS